MNLLEQQGATVSRETNSRWKDTWNQSRLAVGIRRKSEKKLDSGLNDKTRSLARFVCISTLEISKVCSMHVDI